MHPADIRAALNKRGYSILLAANDLSVSDCSVGRVVRGQGRSRRIEQRIAEITDIPLARLWPQWYGPKAHAPLRKSRTPTRNKAELPANTAAVSEGDLTKALLGDIQVQMGNATRLRDHALHTLSALPLADSDWLRLLGLARLMAIIPSPESLEGDQEGSR